VVDRERILSRLDELQGYLRELRSIQPSDLEEFRRIEKRRACERLLQISIETVVDVCHLLVSGLRLGLPGEEDDLFSKLEEAGLLSPGFVETLRRMKGFRNILVHEYGRIDERIVYDMATTRLGDFEAFRREVLKALQSLETTEA
jgi:uncharacterized protein YutE (UPF0331/DUF86 family)